ncbi:MAG: hypothetical protein CMJ82_05440 [Planctomycetaceae bacterium]|nr:hypothetical protein [Planctomycetaceae bacterium]
MALAPDSGKSLLFVMSYRQLIRIIVLLVLAVELGRYFFGDRKTENFAYPARAITLIVPFGEGGESDTFARMIQKAISDHGFLNQQVVVKNVGGAGATIGSGQARQADPDGYTMMILHEALITAQASGKVSYGPESFEPIAASGKTSMIIAVAENSPYQSLTQLMQAARATPNELVFAANLGAPVHYAGLILEKDLPGAHFRYTQKGGGAARFEAVIGGHADVSAFSLGEYVSFKEGGLRALAISSENRHPEAPDIPTAIEQGFDFVHANMHFWWFPKETSQDKVDLIADVIKKCMATEQVKEQLALRLSEPFVQTGQPMKDLLKDRIGKIQSVDATSPDVLPNIPFWVSLVTVLSFIVFWVGRRQSPRADESRPVEQSPLLSVATYWRTASWFVMTTFLYLLALEYVPIDFRIVTAIYMFDVAILCTGFQSDDLKAIVTKTYVPETVILVPLIVFFVFQSFFSIQLP